MKHKLHKNDLLLVIDPQNDFMTGGSLGMKKGDEVIPVINHCLAVADKLDVYIAISRHWHPQNHKSFKANGGSWPTYCVQETPGAMFHKELKIPAQAVIFNKAFLNDKEEYSAFEGVTVDTMISLSEIVKEKGIKRVWMLGFTLEHGVYYSAVGAALLGLETHILSEGCRGKSSKICEKTIVHLKKLGVVFEESVNL